MNFSEEFGELEKVIKGVSDFESFMFLKWITWIAMFLSLSEEDRTKYIRNSRMEIIKALKFDLTKLHDQYKQRRKIEGDNK